MDYNQNEGIRKNCHTKFEEDFWQMLKCPLEEPIKVLVTR